MTRILSDIDVEAVGMDMPVECMERAFRAHFEGRLIAPARLVSDLEIGKLTFTVGALKGPQSVVGFRCYDVNQLYSPQRDEVTVVLEAATGSLLGIVVGPMLGAVRTGAIGGVAIRYLARRDSESLGVIGTGYQARTQLAAALEVRPFETVRVYSRNEQRRNEFAAEMSEQFDRRVSPMGTARATVEDADVIICCTTSSTPVLEPGWLKPGVHINNVGPKFKMRHEIGLDVIQAATKLVTDAPEQIKSFGEEFILYGHKHCSRIEPLSQIVADCQDVDCPARTKDDGLTVFVSMGLAGTEVMLAEWMLDQSKSNA